MGKPVRSRGWTVESDHPDGPTLYPEVIDSVSWEPALNALPRIEIPVRRGDAWEGTSMDGQPIRVWFDGDRLPIDEIVTTRRESEQDVIVAQGGSELDTNQQDIEIGTAKTHTKAKNLIQNRTTYGTNVDSPQTRVLKDQLVQNALTDSEMESIVPAHPFDADRPLEIDGGALQMQQTGFFSEAENGTTVNAETLDSVSTSGVNDEWSGTEVVLLDGDTDNLAYEFTTEHEIPAGDCYFSISFANPDGNPAFNVLFTPEGGSIQNVISVNNGALATTTDKTEHKLFDTELNDGDTLAPGTHKVEIDVTSVGTGESLYLDWVHTRDDRYNYNFDTNVSNDNITGWEAYPEYDDVTFDRAQTIERTVGGSATVQFDDTSNNQRVGIWNGATGSYTFSNNSESVDVSSFASDGSFIQLQIRLSRYDAGSFSGDFGANTQTVVDDPNNNKDRVEVYADTENTPVTIDRSLHGNFVDLLNELAGSTFIWEVTWNQSNSQQQVEWTQAGQRTADEPQLAEFRGSRTVDGTYQKAFVFGNGESVTDARFTVDGSYTEVGVGDDWLQPGSETVYEVGNQSNTFERGVDYEMKYQKGAVNPLSGGNLSTNTEYAIDYSFNIDNSYTEDGVNSPDVVEADVPAATTELQAGQAALRLVEDLQDPLEEATITIANPVPGQNLVDSIQTDTLPLEGPLEQREISQTPRGVEITLGSRSGVGEIVGRIQRRLAQVTEQL